jgi:hypothetical protein
MDKPTTTTTTIAIEFNEHNLAGYEDSYLAMLWHLGQANPAPHGDYRAGEVAARIGREIIRRWLGAAPVELWHHQGRGYYWSQLTRFATYQPGDPDWHSGTWVAKPTSADGA